MSPDDNQNPTTNNQTPIGQNPEPASPAPPLSSPATPTNPSFNQPSAPAFSPTPGVNPSPPFGQPHNTSTAPPPPEKAPVNAGVIVLQWLTYAFWGWTILALSFVTGSVLANLMEGADTGGFTPYAIAATLVLLPISFICDLFYAKHEPIKKTGAETLVMVVHAVIFALFGIGSLIFAVFTVVQLFTSSSGNSSAGTALLTSLIIAVYYALAFLRTLNPPKLGWIQRLYKFIMLGVIAIITVLAVIGPMAYERKVRDDRLIENNLPNVSRAINNYARSHNKLPENLQELSLTGDTQKLLDKNLVTYKPQREKHIEPKTSLDYLNNDSFNTTYYRYELCVNYRERSRYYDESYYDYSGAGQEYTRQPSTYSHPAGEVCYKIEASVF